MSVFNPTQLNQTTVNITISGPPPIQTILDFSNPFLKSKTPQGPKNQALHAKQGLGCHVGEQCKDVKVLIMIVVSPKIEEGYLWRIFIEPHSTKNSIFLVTLNLGCSCGVWTFLSKQHSPNPPSFPYKFLIPINSSKKPEMDAAPAKMYVGWRLST